MFSYRIVAGAGIRFQAIAIFLPVGRRWGEMTNGAEVLLSATAFRPHRPVVLSCRRFDGRGRTGYNVADLGSGHSTRRSVIVTRRWPRPG